MSEQAMDRRKWLPLVSAVCLVIAGVVMYRAESIVAVGLIAAGFIEAVAVSVALYRETSK